MARFDVNLLVVLLVVAGSSFCDAFDAQPRVIGGINAVSGQFPEAVFIETPLQPSCVGIVLNANHILTSNQCVLSGQNVTNPFFVRIIAGDLNIFTPTYRRFTATATHIFAHPQYNPVTLANDLAVVRVAPEFPLPHNTIDTAVLNRRVRPIGTGCNFAGWGFSNANEARHTIQQSVALPLLNRDQCNGAAIHAGRVLETMVCAGGLANNAAQAICNGNLGGGLFCNDELVGILSLSTGCAANQIRPPVFTQVRFYETWIQAQFARTDSTFP